MADPVNDEKMLVAYLKAQTDVAAQVGTRISTTLPASFASTDYPLPACRLFRVSGSRRDNFHHDRSRIQIEAWGDDALEAWTAMNAIRAAMNPTRICGTHTEAAGTDADCVVTDSVELTYGRLDDPTTGKARYLGDYELGLHKRP